MNPASQLCLAAATHYVQPIAYNFTPLDILKFLSRITRTSESNIFLPRSFENFVRACISLIFARFLPRPGLSLIRPICEALSQTFAEVPQAENVSLFAGTVRFAWQLKTVVRRQVEPSLEYLGDLTRLTLNWQHSSPGIRARSASTPCPGSNTFNRWLNHFTGFLVSLTFSILTVSPHLTSTFVKLLSCELTRLTC